MFIKEIFAVMLGGGLGSGLRFLLSRYIQSQPKLTDFPWGIFACNVIGCLLMGLFAGILLHRWQLGPIWRAGLLVGLLGGFTTFSSFSIDTISLLQSGNSAAAITNIVLTLLCCLAATAGGLLLTRSLF